MNNSKSALLDSTSNLNAPNTSTQNEQNRIPKAYSKPLYNVVKLNVRHSAKIPLKSDDEGCNHS